MRAFSDRAQSIERRHAQSCREISVGPAANEGFPQRYAHFLRQRTSLRVERGAHLSLHRRAVESTTDFELCARKNRPQRAEFPFERARVFAACRAQINQDSRTFGNHIGARAAFDHSGVYCDSAARLVPPRDARNLERDFFNRIDAVLGIQSRVGRASGRDQFNLANALAARFHAPIEPGRGFEYENGVAAPCFAFNRGARAFAANFLVARPQKDNALLGQATRSGKGVHGIKREHEPAFHIKCAGSPGASSGHAKRHPGDSSGVVHGVQMAQN